MSTFAENIARNLKVERAKRGLLQKELAEVSGVSVSVIARYEMGENIPGLDNALKIAKALGVSIDVLAGYSPQKQ